MDEDNNNKYKEIDPITKRKSTSNNNNKDSSSSSSQSFQKRKLSSSFLSNSSDENKNNNNNNEKDDDEEDTIKIKNELSDQNNNNQADMNLKRHSSSSFSNSEKFINKRKRTNSKSISNNNNKINDYPNEKTHHHHHHHHRKSSSNNNNSMTNENNNNTDQKEDNLINQYKSQLTIPGYDGPLITEELFKKIQQNASNVPEDILKSIYDDYKSKYENKKKISFYEEHKNDEWFKERYDPEVYYITLKILSTQCQKLNALFREKITTNYINKLNLQYTEPKVLLKKTNNNNNSNINYILFTFEKEEKINIGEDKNSQIKKELSNENDDNDNEEENENFDISNSEFFGFEPDNMTLFIHQLPRYISRSQIVDQVSKIAGFVSLVISDPIKAQDYNRYCWLSFDNESNCSNGLELLHDFTITRDYILSPVKSKSNTQKNIKITPKLFTERLDEDINFTREIINILNRDKNIDSFDIEKEYCEDDNNNDTNDNNGKIKKNNKLLILDLQVLYLRKVHGFCYYCFVNADDERTLAIKCDNAHLRNIYIGLREDKDKLIYINDKEKNDIVNYDLMLSQKANEFINKNKEKKENYIKEIDYENDEKLKNLRIEFCKNKIIITKKDSFACDMCSKRFIANNFAIQHILKKHINIVKSSVDLKYIEKLKKEYFLNDQVNVYSKIKVLNDMKEYIDYLKGMKKNQDFENIFNNINNNNNNFMNSNSSRKNNHYNRDYKDNRYYGNNNNNYYNKDKYKTNRHYYREDDDYDNNKRNYEYRNNNLNQGRKLINYSDL